MLIGEFVNSLNADFFVGVPHSQLKALCDYLMNNYDSTHHIIAANEGNTVGIAAGYHLATNKIPVIYLQNSGQGNIINPVASLINEQVYDIPAIFVIGWRGEPNFKDEPQHIFQGQITLQLLDVLNIKYLIVDENTSVDEIKSLQSMSRRIAYVIKKNALTYNNQIKFSNQNKIIREEAIKHIIKVSGEDPIVSTTGKTSRELFENRTEHSHDFLTVGSMGHTSSIAFGIALNTDKKVWCIDGDGSMIMHMGALPVIGQSRVKNLSHIVINNGSHESVGGFPTAAKNLNLSKIAEDCGYDKVACVDDFDSFDKELNLMKNFNGLCFLEIKTAIGSRKDLGRPSTSPQDNKINFKK